MARKNTTARAVKSRSNTMWGGRFAGPAAIMERINASIGFDRRMYAQDIAGSLAACRHAGGAGHHLRPRTAAPSGAGCSRCAQEIESGSFEFSTELEDIHMNVEARLTDADRRGRPAGCTPRARATTRWRSMSGSGCATRSTGSMPQLADLQAALIDRAEEHAATVMPGFTHLQTAQPVTFGHHLLAYVEMLGRDRGRFADCRARLNECPLGAAALAGTSFPIDRHMTAKALGFDRPMANSLDAVSDRDFALEFLAAASICGDAPLAPGRGDRDLVQRAVPLRRAVGCLHHRQLDHAAEAQPGCGRAGARQDRPHRRRLRGAAAR